MTRRNTVRAAGALLAAMAATALSGCGIRATEVPTDFGPAPSRAACQVAGGEMARPDAEEFTAAVSLVCGGRLVDVDRGLPLRERQAGDPVRMARALLKELGRAPSAGEERAGFSTDVRRRLTVSGPGEGDPREALRLGTLPENLSVFALAQVVCTFAQSPAAASDGSVVLGGPADAPLRRYSCTDEVRTRPGTAPTPAQTVSP
ncbi:MULTISPECIES: hypothetical protein [Streptomyces]|uniref:Lipoprotein n=4 Tax=Streptomyces TaxID=1883 RepID=A0A8H9HGC0_9ACTN|nr:MULTISPECIES: hypothetical protein [Streptomyces]NEE40083.1 hypothetical protein [Streptomyces sp. SID7982]NEE46745.1 hypothetical protein [Streptomyces sp. SID8455]MBL3806515.1 hypothetical protein [Streptomyces sp. BRB081]MDQ0295318.1 hypothetical protein [Streptomyces sp. DSM 41037]PJM84795.1 hypothetical protein CH313_02040 [Streptomyces sp. TSRI0384-2]